MKMENKNTEIIKEVMDEIDSALKDPNGINSHQRRIAFSLSLGVVFLIEEYLKKKEVFKSGAKINHLWLKKKRDNVKKLISNHVTCPVEKIVGLDKLLDLAFKIEKDRNEIAYGKVVSGKVLNEKINLFLELKNGVEN